MCLKTKILPFVAFLFLSWNMDAQVESDSVQTLKKLDSLSSEISLLKSRQQNVRVEIRNLTNEFRQTTDSFIDIQNSMIREFENKNLEMKEEFEFQNSVLQQEINHQAEERERIKKRFITSSLLLFVVLIIIFIYFFYRNYLMEKYIDDRILKSSLEADSRIDSLKSKILPRLNKLKKRSKTTERNLEKAEKRFLKLKKKK